MLTDLKEENSGNYTVKGRNFANASMAQFCLTVRPGTCTIVKLYSECMVVHITRIPQQSFEEVLYCYVM